MLISWKQGAHLLDKCVYYKKHSICFVPIMTVGHSQKYIVSISLQLKLTRNKTLSSLKFIMIYWRIYKLQESVLTYKIKIEFSLQSEQCLCVIS